MQDQIVNGDVFEGFTTALGEKDRDFREPHNDLLFRCNGTPISPEEDFRGAREQASKSLFGKYFFELPPVDLSGTLGILGRTRVAAQSEDLTNANRLVYNGAGSALLPIEQIFQGGPDKLIATLPLMGQRICTPEELKTFWRLWRITKAAKWIDDEAGEKLGGVVIGSIVPHNEWPAVLNGIFRTGWNENWDAVAYAKRKNDIPEKEGYTVSIVNKYGKVPRLIKVAEPFVTDNGEGGGGFRRRIRSILNPEAEWKIPGLIPVGNK